MWTGVDFDESRWKFDSSEIAESDASIVASAIDVLLHSICVSSLILYRVHGWSECWKDTHLFSKYPIFIGLPLIVVKTKNKC